MRLFKNKRVESHKKVYGKTFSVEDDVMLDNKTYIKVTKLTKKGTSDRIHITLTGTLQYDCTPYIDFAHITWTESGPRWHVKRAVHIDESIVKQIIKGCEAILLEITILEES